MATKKKPAIAVREPRDGAKRSPVKAKGEKKLPIGKGTIGITVGNSYKVTAAKLWEAITLAKHTQKYFVTKVTGDFTAKLSPVQWYWKKWGSFTQTPTVYQKEKKLVFLWADHSKKYNTTVTFTLKKKGKMVDLEINEKSWKRNHLANAFSNCEGWTTYLCYLKAYVQKGIVLSDNTRA